MPATFNSMGQTIIVDNFVLVCTNHCVEIIWLQTIPSPQSLQSGAIQTTFT